MIKNRNLENKIHKILDNSVGRTITSEYVADLLISDNFAYVPSNMGISIRLRASGRVRKTGTTARSRRYGNKFLTVWEVIK